MYDNVWNKRLWWWSDGDGDNGICEYDGTPTPSFNWLQEVVVTGFVCKRRVRTIIAATKDDFVFGNQCKASQLECHLDGSIIYWSLIALLDDCPFRKVKTLSDVQYIPEF